MGRFSAMFNYCFRVMVVTMWAEISFIGEFTKDSFKKDASFGYVFNFFIKKVLEDRLSISDQPSTNTIYFRTSIFSIIHFTTYNYAFTK